MTSTGEEVDAASVGLDQETVEHIWQAGVDLYRTGVHPGLQLCLRRDGKVVLDRAIGHARGNGPDDDGAAEKVPMTPGTPACIFSASKAVTAMVIHLLDERGLLHIGDRVSEYIPEYAQNGKEGTTIAHVLAHRAGVASMPKEAKDLDSLTDPDRILQLICEGKPSIRPGRLLAYHAVSGGYILGEIVKRVTAKSIREVLAEEILDPLGFRWGNYGVLEEDFEEVAPSYVTGPPLLPPLSTLVDAGAGRAARRSGRRLERRPVPDRRDPVGQRVHERQRARPILRDLSGRRRDGRRAGDAGADDPSRARPSSPTWRSTSR